MSTRKILIAAVAAVAAVTAFADTAAATDHSEVVSYSDLDLSSPEGVRTLNQRIVQAAHRICRAEQGTGLVPLSEYQDCRQSAISAASVTRDQAITRLAGTGTAQVRAAR